MNHRFAIALLATTALTAAMGQLASAADLPVRKAPPPPVTVWSWTGFYIGGNVGFSSGKADNRSRRA
jgi:outer membrane immunogenic protein